MAFSLGPTHFLHHFLLHVSILKPKTGYFPYPLTLPSHLWREWEAMANMQLPLGRPILIASV